MKTEQEIKDRIKELKDKWKNLIGSKFFADWNISLTSQQNALEWCLE